MKHELVIAKDIALNTQGNLTIESLQNSSEQKSKSFGVNVGNGVRTGSSGNAGAGGANSIPGGPTSVNFGINYGSSKSDRLWTDNQTSVIGTNSVAINTGSKTNLVGALVANITNPTATRENQIDGGNLTLNTGSLTYKNLYDHDYSRSSGFGFSRSFGVGGSSSTGAALAANNTTGQGTAPATNPNQQNSFYPNGSTTISANDSGYKKEQTTFATIGNGNITTGATISFDANGNSVTSTGGSINDQTNLASLNRDVTKSQVITKYTITGALNVSTTIDNRIIAAAVGVTLGGTETGDAAWDSLMNDQMKLGENSKITTTQLLKLGAAVPLTPMFVNIALEPARGRIPQSAKWGGPAVYKSGDEPNGVRDAEANNIGEEVVWKKLDGSIDWSKVGQKIPFSWSNFFSFEEGGAVSLGCNYAVPGCNDMSLTHDPLVTYLKKTFPNVPDLIINKGTIVPAYVGNTYGIIGKPWNMLIEYLERPSFTVNTQQLFQPQASVSEFSAQYPVLNQNFLPQ